MNVLIWVMCAALVYGMMIYVAVRLSRKMRQEYQADLERIKQFSENLDELQNKEGEAEDSQEQQPTFATYNVDIVVRLDYQSGMAKVRVGGFKIEDGDYKKVTLEELKAVVQSAMDALDSDDAHDQWIRGVMGG